MRSWTDRLRSQRFFVAAGGAFIAALAISRGMVNASTQGRIAIGIVCALLGIAGVVSTILAAKHAFTPREGESDAESDAESNAALAILLIAVLAVLNLSAILIGVIAAIEQLAEL